MVHLIHHREKTHDDHVDRPVDRPVDERAAAARQGHAHDRFGGVNLGAAFAGWLVAVALSVLLTGIVGAVASAIGASTDFSQSDAQREAGAIGLGAAIAVVAILVIAYFYGGYVAGRMSRFDGARQGLVAWLIGLLVTIAAVVAGVVFGDEYNALDRVDLPQIPIPTDTATWGGLIAAVAIVVGTLLAAMIGGKVGHRYHDRVDRVAYPR